MLCSPFARATAASLLLGLSAGAPALAQTWLQATVVVDAMHFVVGIDDPFTDDGYLGLESATPFGRIAVLADSDHQPQAYHGLGIAWSQVGLGSVQVYAQAQSVASGADLVRVTGSGQASGFVSDFFALSVPGAASGAVFTATAQVRVDGSAWAETLPGWNGAYQPAGQLAAFSHWESWVRVLQGGTGSTLAELRAREDCDARTNQGSGPFCVADGLPGLQTITFTMTNNGTPVQLDMRGWASAGTSIYQPTQLTSADSRADMGHTIAWGGITELRDASGQIVDNYTAVSASSGYDYRNAYVGAVPEAPTSLLLLAGLAMLGTGWRRGLRRPA